MQGYLRSRPQLERGALGSVVIAGGVKMKFSVGLCAILLCGEEILLSFFDEKKA